MQADQNKFSSLTANIPEPKAGTISYKAATAAAVAAQNAAVSSSLPNLLSAPITVNGITKGKRLGFSEGIGENKQIVSGKKLGGIIEKDKQTPIDKESATKLQVMKNGRQREKALGFDELPCGIPGSDEIAEMLTGIDYDRQYNRRQRKGTSTEKVEEKA